MLQGVIVRWVLINYYLGLILKQHLLCAFRCTIECVDKIVPKPIIIAGLNSSISITSSTIGLNK